MKLCVCVHQLMRIANSLISDYCVFFVVFEQMHHGVVTVKL